MLAQATAPISIRDGFPSNTCFADYLDDLGDLQDLKDPINRVNLALGKVDEPDPRH